MKDKELKRLSRAELLELLLEQTKEVERLQEALDKAQSLLAERHIKVTEAGDLAHAVLAVNNVMEAAQQAAQQYIDSIAAMKVETEEQCRQLLLDAQEEAKQLIAGKTTEDQVIDDGSNELSQLDGSGAGAETGTV